MKLAQKKTGTAKVTNVAGGDAYAYKDIRTKLITGAASCLFGEPKYYGDNTADIVGTFRAVARIHPEWSLKLAAYMRNVWFLRTTPQVFLVEASKIAECQPYIRKYAPTIMRRADEPLEVLTYNLQRFGSKEYLAKNGRPHRSVRLARQLKLGTADAYTSGRWKEYHLQKYYGTGKQFNQQRAFRLIHPKPKDEAQEKLFKLVVNNELPTPDTWETISSGPGTPEEKWTKIYTMDPPVPIMAALRNLNNLLRYVQDTKIVMDVCNRISEPEVIRRSKQFPFRFLSAYRAVENNTGGRHRDMILAALKIAMKVAINNVPRIDGYTVIISDNSASMDATISGKSTVRRRDVSAMLASIAQNKCELSRVGAFGAQFAWVKDIGNEILTNANKIANTHVGHCTYAYLAFDTMRREHIKPDRVIIVSDEQCYTPTGQKHRGWGFDSTERINAFRKVSPKTFIHMIDVGGYMGGSMIAPEDQACLLAGWSDNLIKFIPTIESGGKGLPEAIEEYTPF